MATQVTDAVWPEGIVLDNVAYSKVTIDLNEYFTLGDGESYSIEQRPGNTGFAVVSDPRREPSEGNTVEPHIIDINLSVENFNEAEDLEEFEVIIGVPGIETADRSFYLRVDDQRQVETGWCDPRVIYNAERLSLEAYYFQKLKDDLMALDGLRGFRVQAENAPIEDLTRFTPDRVRFFARVVDGEERQVTIGGRHPRYVNDGEFVSTIYLPFAQADRRLLDWCVGVVTNMFRKKSLNVSAYQKPDVYLPALDALGRRIWERLNADGTLTMGYLDIERDPISDTPRKVALDNSKTFRLANRAAQGDEDSKYVLSLVDADGTKITDSPLNWIPRYAMCLKSCRIRFRPQIRVSGSAASGGWSMITVHAAFESDRRFVETDWRAAK